jgi:serine/threonine protein kinase
MPRKPWSKAEQLTIASRPRSVWVPDSGRLTCSRCHKVFNITRRRHHCRMCGAVYCAECCPKTNAIAASVVRDNVSMPRQQRAMERLCRSCRLPSWLLPMTVERVRLPGGPRSAENRHAVRGETSTSSARRRPPSNRFAQWLTDHLEPRVDACIMQTLLEYCSTQTRNELIRTHPAIRYCMPLPPIHVSSRVTLPMRFEDSISSVFPGIVVGFDCPHSGSFRRGPERTRMAAMSVGEIGSGMDATSYIAMDRVNHCFVVVKVIPKNYPRVAEKLRYSWDWTFGRTAREIQIHASLDSTHTVRLLDAFQTMRNIVVVSAAGEGRTARLAAAEVDRVIRASQASTPGTTDSKMEMVAFTLRVIQQVVLGLQYMASKGYVHRDVKLDNVILSKDYSFVRLIDFGFAESIKADQEARYAPLGTPDFVSPECLFAMFNKKSFVADRATILAGDVFSVGAMAYLAITKRSVYKDEHDESTADGRDPMKKHHRASKGIRCKDSYWWRDVPDDVAELVEWMLRFDPKQRPTHEQILSHPCFQKYQPDMEDVVKRRYERMKQEDDDFGDVGWDLGQDDDDNDDDDDEGRAAVGSVRSTFILQLQNRTPPPPLAPAPAGRSSKSSTPKHVQHHPQRSAAHESSLTTDSEATRRPRPLPGFSTLSESRRSNRGGNDPTTTVSPLLRITRMQRSFMVEESPGQQQQQQQQQVDVSFAWASPASSTIGGSFEARGV